MAKIKFKDWYCQRYNVAKFPGEPGEAISGSMERLAEAMAEWADLVAEGKIPEALPSTNGGE